MPLPQPPENHREPDLETGKDPLSIAHLKSIMICALVGAMAVYAGAAALVWGDWPRVAAVGVLCLVGMLFNWLVTASAVPRLGVELAEDLRVMPNILAMVGLGFATNWSFVSLLFMPFSAALVHGLHTRRPTLRLTVTIGSTSVIGLVAGADPALIIGMAALTIFLHVVALGKTNFARGILLERQRHLAELATSHQNLIQAQESALVVEKLASIGLVAAGVAHEINNPMSFITANMSALLEDLQAEQLLSPVIKEYRDEIVPSTLDGVRRVNSIVDDLRRFASGEPETRIPFDLGTEIDAAVRMARSQLRSGQRLRTDIQPGASGLCGMPRQISQVALNLIVNAIQASRDDGEIIVSSGTLNGEAVFRVKDSGTGIPAELLERIFTPFVTTKAAGKGTGLGLAVADRLIKAHGGRISVASVVGRGTTFEVFLPLTEAAPFASAA